MEKPEPEYEYILNEIVRRGGKKWTAFLQNKFDEIMALRTIMHPRPDDTCPGSYYNLELLTALRRIEKKPDPLEITIENISPITAEITDYPQIKVVIKNTDIEKSDAAFTFGGNYRSGRQARWRIQITLKDGSELPIIIPQCWIGGGIYQPKFLKHGEGWQTTLDLRRFVEMPPPGEYMLRVQYHNELCIANEESVSGMIVFNSEPVKFIVHTPVVVLSGEDIDKIRKLAARIIEIKPLKLVRGQYGPWAHKFVKPGTPEGKLLSMGIKAAPVLIKMLQNQPLSGKKRAWLLSILYSITGTNDPGEGRILGHYYFISAGWAVWGQRTSDKDGGGGGFGFISNGESTGSIDLQVQEKIICKWIEFARQIKVVTADGKRWLLR